MPYPPPLQPESSPPIKLLLVRLAKSASLIRLYPQNLHDSAVHHKPCFRAQLSIVNTRFQGTVASPSEIPGCSVCPCLLSIPLMPLSGQSLEPVCWTHSACSSTSTVEAFPITKLVTRKNLVKRVIRKHDAKPWRQRHKRDSHRSC